MLVFDQLKRDDSQLRWLAVLVLAGMLVLLSGLWWVQVVSANHFREKLETQSIRTVRVPAVRGKILDRNGLTLAENLPTYSVDLYLEDLSKNFQAACAAVASRARTNLAVQKAIALQNLGHRPSKTEERDLNRQFAMTRPMKDALDRETRYWVASNIVSDLSERLNAPLGLAETNFQRHYSNSLALPMSVLARLSPDQIARFEEQSMHMPGLDLKVQSIRNYPSNSLAAHLLGYVIRNKDSMEGELAEYDYRLDDYAGISGLERMFDKDLHGVAGGKSVLVNNWGYRQNESTWQPAEPGQNLVLTIDADIQAAAERALRIAQADVRGAVVVMDARNGDILAMASEPTFDPNHFVRQNSGSDPAWDDARWVDPLLAPQKNRAMQENYHPGSTFKIVVALAALEEGVLDPQAKFTSLGYYPRGRNEKPIHDTAGAGEFDLNRAMAMSSNPYFITQGLKPGVLQRIIALGQKFHFGEKTGLIRNQETPGLLPSMKRISSRTWYPGLTMYLSIGQGEIDVTPLQMAVMTAAVANGGTVFWPRVVSRIEPADGIGTTRQFTQGFVRDHIGVSKSSLDIVRRAMLEDVISPEGSGRTSAIPGWQIAGKTGTAEVEKGGRKDSAFTDTWFVSFAPYENPRYVVVAFVEGGHSGAKTCAPVVRDVYKAIIQRENKPAPKTQTLAGGRQ